ncbi:putative quinol monooxygenase [Nocardioides sp. cx-173]|uniref:putative quinol monooxygenase n=1 Tax=Nocardioides sp. cx-173 TaxID=2898796 RepID=UPI001E2B3F40|nr:antibiotic biosynthesis monooxygenase [Nocardioides sp. cx-173]MCD4524233.1 antibiotic biosynthesis monooxygenase [Nocardioides sp. cx-173]UGB41625.1 antibiotic biosynthesis monooxygenase [Nocardioides sp. cx-173]
MLLLSVSMTFAPEDFDDVKAYVTKLQGLSRTEPGCVEYWWAMPVDEEHTLRLFECWESKEALVEHLKLPHEQEWFATYQPKVVSSSVVAYDPTTSGPFGGL